MGTFTGTGNKGAPAPWRSADAREMMCMSQQNVSRILNTGEVRATVDEAQQITATGAKLAAENMIGAAEYFSTYHAMLEKGEKPGQGIDDKMVDLATRHHGK